VSAAEETEPITLYGGPFDGLELDVRPTETEVYRVTPSGRTVRYFRHGCCRFYFDPHPIPR
jgi:hypothetical protein